MTTSAEPVLVVRFPKMTFRGVASSLSADVEDWHLTNEEAQGVIAEILRDEPSFERPLWAEALEFELSVN